MSTDLKKRHSIEQEFHDHWAKNMSVDSVLVKESFDSPTASENRYALEILGNIKDKNILDVGCGAGDTAVYFALQGAIVTAVDISPEMIKVTKKVASKFGVKIKTAVMVSEKLEFPDACFDFVFGNGILHHSDLTLASNEIKRILKKGGKAVFVEPLADNPIINIYRRLANQVRTTEEKPLTQDEIKKFCSVFENKKIHPFHLTTLLIFIWFLLGEWVTPNSDRYWKRIILYGERYKGVFNLLYKIDELVFKLFPILGRFYWNSVIVVER